MIPPGRMFRNGHGRCGGCRMLVTECQGGRKARKAGGWIYTGRHVLGWVCRYCKRWARPLPAEIREAPPAPEPAPVVHDTPTVRGFGAVSVGSLLSALDIEGAPTTDGAGEPAGWSPELSPSRWRERMRSRRGRQKHDRRSHGT